MERKLAKETRFEEQEEEVGEPGIWRQFRMTDGTVLSTVYGWISVRLACPSCESDLPA